MAKSVKAKANATEKKLAKDVGGYRQPASGALDGMKGDVVMDEYLLDSKETGAKSIIVSSKDLNKVSKEAREMGRTPALVLKLSGVQLGTAKQWVCLPLRDFMELVEDESN